MKLGMGNWEWGIERLVRIDHIADSLSYFVPAPRSDRAGRVLLLSDSPFPIPYSRP
jgi:hypothetical protein